jgi:acetyl-CoA decarbonylase/synthase, CODH/ACS complex subunit delta
MSYDKNIDTFLEKIIHILEKKGSVDFKNVDINIKNVKAFLEPTLANIQSFKEKSKQIEYIPLEEPFPPTTTPHFHPIQEIVFKRTNGNEVKIGGDIVPPYYTFFKDKNSQSIKNPNSPKVTFDVFDMKIKLPKVIKNAYKGVLEHPAEWAKLAVKYGAELITLHFTSTDPGVKDTPVSKALTILDDVLQAVKVPIIIGGSGNKKKDTELFKACAAATEGNRFMLSSADKLTWDKIVPIAKKYDHNILLWAQLDINDQTKLVEDAIAMGMPRDRIVLDPTCATLGYGLEYSYSIYQKIRIAGLKGDDMLSFPISAGTTNAWGGREAWMKKLSHMPANGGSRELRGPLWEITTALTMSLVGMNLAMMFHPLAASTFKEVIDEFYAEVPKSLPDYQNWVSAKY